MNKITPRELLENRLATRSQRGARNDNAHLALVLEGGGMRGVVSIGMASAFEEVGYFDAFDSIHGSSAGACGAAYFASGLAASGGRIYFEDINNNLFIDVRRPLIGKPIMDKDFLIEHVMRSVKPLDPMRIIASPGFLNIVATNASDGKARLFDAFSSIDEILTALKASICLPLIAGRSVQVNGVDLVDGGIVQQIAMDSAAAKGATHAIVLMTRSDGEFVRRPNHPHRAETLVLGLVYGRNLRDAYAVRNERINAVVEAIRSGSYPLVNGGKILVDAILRKAGTSEVSRLCKDEGTLKTAFAEGREAVFEYLDEPDRS